MGNIRSMSSSTSRRSESIKTPTRASSSGGSYYAFSLSAKSSVENDLLIIRHFVKLQILVNLLLVRLNLFLVNLQELRWFRQFAHQCSHRTQLSRTEVDLGSIAYAIIEVTGRSGKHVNAIRHAGLVTHAKRAAGNLDACAKGAVDREICLVLELLLKDLPQPDAFSCQKNRSPPIYAPTWH